MIFFKQLIPSILLLLVQPSLVSQWRLSLTHKTEKSIRVSGVIRDAVNKQPLTGASVYNSRTHEQVVTDIGGKFALPALYKDTLLIQALGYKIYRLVLYQTNSSLTGLQINLQHDTIQLGEVRVTAKLEDRININRALNNIKRPILPVKSGPIRPPEPAPLFPVDSTPPPPPPFGNSPIGLLYSKFSREGKERRKMAQIKARIAQEKEHQKTLEYNKFFKDNRGYE